MIVSPDFCDHWKTRLLVDLLKDEAAPVYLLRLWSHCQNRKSDKFTMSATAVRAVCRSPHDAAQFEAALIESGFLRRDGGDVEALGWAEYNSGIISSWENGKRGGRPRKPVGKPNNNPRVNPPVIPVNPSETDKIREDEMREDKNLGEVSPKNPSGTDDGKTGKAEKPKRKPRTKHHSDDLAVFDVAKIPPVLMTDGFPDAWQQWLTHRKAKKQPVTVFGQNQAWARAIEVGAKTAASKLKQAMSNGYQGWDFDRNQEGTNGKKQQPRSQRISG